jgi:uncharacterized protein (TIGR02246 family)
MRLNLWLGTSISPSRRTRNSRNGLTPMAMRTALWSANMVLFLTLIVGGTRIAHAQARTARRSQTLASAIPVIALADSEWLGAMRLQDAERIVAPYDNDAIFLTAGGIAIRGRANIAALYRARFPKIVHVLGGGIVQDGIRAVNDTLVYEWGHGGMTYTDSASINHTVNGPYLTVWRRFPSGKWLIIRNLVF